jgi:PilZ domain
MSDRRKHQRWPAYWAGRIKFNRSDAVAECLVRNTSGSGAKLVVRGAVFVPREFVLHIPKHGIDYRATVIWRRSEEVGVAFERIEAGDVRARLAERRRLRQQKPLSPDVREAMTPMALLRELKRLRQQNAALLRRLLMQTD